MKKNLLYILSISLCMVSASNVVAETELYKNEDVTLKTDASLRVRHEFENWAGPVTFKTKTNFGHSKLQFGITAEGEQWKLYQQGQYFQLYGLDSDISGGPDAAYFSANNKDTSPGGLTLRQSYLTIRDSRKENQKATLGRFLYSGGAEVASSDPQMTWIKNQRISQRLIGPFDFTGGRSFDGARIDLKQPETWGTVTLHASHPTQGGFETNSFNTISQISLATVAWTMPLEEKTQDGQIFFYNYGDDRNVLKTDNRTIESRTEDTEKININTVGGSYAQIFHSEGMSYDTLVWVAYQEGDWGTLDHRAYSYDVEAGAKFEDSPLKPWVRVGHTYASGDGNNGDSKHKTFFSMLPTARVYAMTPLYAQQNLDELFGQLSLTASEQVTVRTSAHLLNLANSNDAQYFGSGAGESASRFGFGGNSLHGFSTIGTLLDCEVAYAATKEITLTGYLGRLIGGDGYDAYAGDGGRSSVDYGFLEVSYKL